MRRRLGALDGGFALDAVSVCVDDALDALYELTGESASDAVIDEVFSKFLRRQMTSFAGAGQFLLKQRRTVGWIFWEAMM